MKKILIPLILILTIFGFASYYFLYQPSQKSNGDAVLDNNVKIPKTDADNRNNSQATTSVPIATLTVNGTSTKSVTINDGGSITIFWSSRNADKYPIFLTTTECLDPKMNKADFLYGELSASGSDKFTIGGTQSSDKVIGCDFAFTYVVKNTATGEHASDTVHIKVNR